jgi:hypothetical protein
MKLFFAAAAALFLSACGTIGSITGLNTLGIDPERIETLNEQITVRVAEADGFTTLTRSLLANDVITADQAELVLVELRKVETIADAALAAIETSGDPTQAESLLTQINSAMGLVLSLLNGFAPSETAALMEDQNHVSNYRTSRRSERHKHHPPRLARGYRHSLFYRLA